MSARYFVSIVVLCVAMLFASVAVATVIPPNSILATTGSSITVLNLSGTVIGSFALNSGTAIGVGQLSAGGEIVVPNMGSAIGRYDGSGTYTGAYSGVPGSSVPTHITVGNGIPYVSLDSGAVVVRLDPVSGAVDATSPDFTAGYQPRGSAFRDGYLYVADTSTTSAGQGVWKLPADLSTKTHFASITTSNSGVAFGPDGNLYVADYWNYGAGVPYDTVRRYNGTTGVLIDTFASDPISSTNNQYAGILFKPDGNLLVAACNSGKILEFQGPYGASPGAYVGQFAALSGVWGLSLTPAPEPSTLVLLATGLLGLLAYAWRKRK